MGDVISYIFVNIFCLADIDLFSNLAILDSLLNWLGDALSWLWDGIVSIFDFLLEALFQIALFLFEFLAWLVEWAISLLWHALYFILMLVWDYAVVPLYDEFGLLVDEFIAELDTMIPDYPNIVGAFNVFVDIAGVLNAFTFSFALIMASFFLKIAVKAVPTIW